MDLEIRLDMISSRLAECMAVLHAIAPGYRHCKNCNRMVTLGKGMCTHCKKRI